MTPAPAAPRLASTRPPPPMPAMSPRYDLAPREMLLAGADSRYYRVRRELETADELLQAGRAQVAENMLAHAAGESERMDALSTGAL